jgi:hypothetical protein
MTVADSFQDWQQILAADPGYETWATQLDQQFEKTSIKSTTYKSLILLKKSRKKPTKIYQKPLDI